MIREKIYYWEGSNLARVVSVLVRVLRVRDEKKRIESIPRLVYTPAG